MAFDLVGRIVTAGAVRRAHEQVDLFAIEHLALDLQPDVADNHHGPFRPRDLHREIDHGVRFRRSGDECPVGAATARGIADDGLQRIGIARAVLHAEATRAADARGIEVEADHIAAGGAQQLRSNLTD